ncbi:hypothetical protein DB30_02683 [Enhygromyxa salina]|uniref:Uncharacterized protein n=2 Tax=Enhygromyxa salina TaxID=215803 RepID=A0A0C2DIB0_9BACT|nr:hypothetical protein DB30_02683 [Enhygromyxa salina]
MPSEAELPAPDFDDFRATIYPLLLRDCGLSRCHGDADRFFAVWGPGRQRLAPEFDEPLDPPTEDEVWLSYQRTRAALTHDRAPGGQLISKQLLDAPLLRKPLEGHDHAGQDRWGHNLWTREDPRWRMLVVWAAGVPLEEIGS